MNTLPQPLNPALAIIELALASEPHDAYDLLRMWMEGDFDAIRQGWPQAPDAVFAGAEVCHPETAAALAGSTRAERIEALLREVYEDGLKTNMKAWQEAVGDALRPSSAPHPRSIRLTDPAALTHAAVAALLGSVEDDRNWQLRVRKDGVAYLSDVVGNADTDGLAFRLETWCAGTGHVGPAAAKDAAWVAEVLRDLQDNWPTPKSTVIDF